MYASQMQNVSACRFLYRTGEEHTIRLLLKFKDNIVVQQISDIFGQIVGFIVKTPNLVQMLSGTRVVILAMGPS